MIIAIYLGMLMSRFHLGYIAGFRPNKVNTDNTILKLLEAPLVLLLISCSFGYCSKLLFDYAAKSIDFGGSMIEETDREIYEVQWYLRNESNGKSTLNFEQKKEEMIKEMK